MRKAILKTSILILFLVFNWSAQAQTYSADTCVALSASRVLNLGMDKIYTNFKGPVKSITTKNKKWQFDTNGNIIEELNFNARDASIIDQRKVVEFHRSGQMKSISIYGESTIADKNAAAMTSQEIYNWNNTTRTLIVMKGVDTVNMILERMGKNGCVVMRREEKGNSISETQYGYTTLGLQNAKRYKQWNGEELKKHVETNSSFENGVMVSRTAIDHLSGKITHMNYKVDKAELKGYLLDAADPGTNTHTISRNATGEIVFRQYDDRAFYKVDSTKDGIRIEEKIFVHDDGTKKADRFEFASNGDVTITVTKNGALESRTTKKQQFDKNGNWIELSTIREQSNKPDRQKTILREIEYF